MIELNVVAKPKINPNVGKMILELGHIYKNVFGHRVTILASNGADIFIGNKGNQGNNYLKSGLYCGLEATPTAAQHLVEKTGTVPVFPIEPNKKYKLNSGQTIMTGEVHPIQTYLIAAQHYGWFYAQTGYFLGNIDTRVVEEIEEEDLVQIGKAYITKSGRKTSVLKEWNGQFIGVLEDKKSITRVWNKDGLYLGKLSDVKVGQAPGPMAVTGLSLKKKV